MIPADLMTTPVELLASSEQTGAYGTPRRVPADSGPTVYGWVEQESSVESAADGQRLVDGWKAYLPAGIDLDGWSHVRVAGVVYELDGAPIVHNTPAGPHHVEARWRRIR